MKIEIFTSCDFAQDNFGKLTIAGVFDTINTRAVPMNHPFMCVAVRMRCMMYELGRHDLRIEIRDPNEEFVVPPFAGTIDVSNIGLDSGVGNIVLNHIGMQFKHFGKYTITLFVDGKDEARIPLYVNKIAQG